MGFIMLPLFKKFILLLIICSGMCMGTYKDQRGQSPGTVVTGSCELPSVGARN